MRRFVFLFALCLALPAAAQNGQQVGSLIAEAGPIAVIDVTGGLERPWGMTFLPDGRMLVTERPGRLRIVEADGTVSDPVGGTPTVYAQGQGGLLDVALDPDFGDNGYVYFSYAKPGPGGSAATALGRAVMQGDSLSGWEELFVQEPFITGPNHFGTRIAFGLDDHIFLTTGERFQFDPAQDLSNHLGTIVRLHRDGSVPGDNPFVGQADAQEEIWSYGHRNLEAAVVHPETGDLWVAEMGPLGGDELNRIEKGRNYGWPVVSWGMNYDGTDIPDPPTRPEFADAVTEWTPVISPSGMAVYTADVFSEWTGSVMIGSLSQQGIMRVAVGADGSVEKELVPLGARIREVEVGPDGLLYVLTDQDDGHIWRLEPLSE